MPKPIIAKYKPKSVAEMQSALKEVLGPMFEAMLNGEMESYLGYEPNSREKKETTNWRNYYFDKTIKTSMSETEIEVPRDRQASFNSIILPKHKRDVSDIENKVLAMYSRGMSQSNISATIDDIYGFKLSAEQKFPKSQTTYSKNNKVGKTVRLHSSIRSSSSTACSRLLSAITRQKNAPFTTFWAFVSTDIRNFGALDTRQREQTRLDADFRRTQDSRR